MHRRRPLTVPLRPLALALLFALNAAALPTLHAQTASSRAYNLPAAPLATTLNKISRDAGLTLTVDSGVIGNRQASPVHGQFSPEQALHAALAGSGLELMKTDAGTYTLRKSPAATPGEASLTPVTVTADALQENAWGPVKGYVAKRSATATKTDTPIIETPQSITVIGAEEIETLKSQSLQDALGYVAGVNRAEGQDRTTDAFFLRGFKTGNSSVFRDGSQYVVNYYNGQQEPYGLERIELLKGAASVLYGAAAPGGLINTVSKRPTTEALHELNVELGSFKRRQVSGDFAGALDQTGDWSYRFTFLKRDSDTAIDHVPDDRTYIAPALKWQPDANTSLALLAEYQKDHTVYLDGLPAEGTVLANSNGRISRTVFTGEPGYDKFKLERYSVGYLFEHAFNEQWKLRHSLRYYHAQNEYNYTWGWGLSSDQRSTAWRGAQDRWDRSSAVVTDSSLQYLATHGLFQHTALIGIDYALPKHESERYNRDVANLDYYSPVYGSALGTATPAAFSWKSEMQRLGIYAQDQMKIADKWVVLLGGRQDYVRYDERSFFTGEKTIDNEKSQAFTGRAGLVYLADNGLAPFLSYSESFEPTDGKDRQGSRFKPTTGKQYEAGVRYQPKGSDTLISAAVYQLTRDNVTVADPLDSNYSIQAGRVRSRGFELEARTRVGRHGNLIAAYAYTDGRTLKASPLQPEQEGQRSYSTPYNQISLWGDYSLGAIGLPGIKIGAGARYLDKTLGQAQGTTVTLSSFTLIDAMLSYKTGPWRFALNATNLTDKTYIASCTYGCFYGEPRKLIASVNYRW
jgi:iron complex outermembrane receptor protein